MVVNQSMFKFRCAGTGTVAKVAQQARAEGGW